MKIPVFSPYSLKRAGRASGVLQSTAVLWQALLNKDQHLEIPNHPPRGIHDIGLHVEYVRGIHDTNPHLLQIDIIPVLHTVSASPSIANAVKHAYIKHDLTYQGTISSALTQKNQPVHVGVSPDFTHMVMTYRLRESSQDDTLMEQNLFYAAFMMYAHQHPSKEFTLNELSVTGGYYNTMSLSSLIGRLQSAITSSTAFQPAEEEYRIIEAYRQQAIKARAFEGLRRGIKDTFAMPDTTDNDISVAESRIAEYEDEIRALEATIRQLQYDKHIASFKEDAIEEFEQYLEEECKDRVIFSHRHGRSLYITLKSYMSLGTNAKDFFKSIDDPRNKLYDHPILTILLQDVLDKNLLISLVATFKIKRDSTGELILAGSPDYEREHNDPPRFLHNRHITYLGCFRQHKVVIQRLHRERNLIGMFEQMFEAAGSLNLFDNVALNRTKEFFDEGMNHESDLFRTQLVRYRTEDGWVEMTLEKYIANHVEGRVNREVIQARREEPEVLGREDAEGPAEGQEIGDDIPF